MQRVVAIVVGVIVIAAAIGRAPAAAADGGCTTATSSCTEWGGLGGGARSMIYRSYSLDQRNDTVRRALIMVHGTNRNADHYFTTAMGAAFFGGAVDDTVVISPRLTACQDKLEPNEVGWSCNGDS